MGSCSNHCNDFRVLTGLTKGAGAIKCRPFPVTTTAAPATTAKTTTTPDAVRDDDHAPCVGRWAHRAWLQLRADVLTTIPCRVTVFAVHCARP